MNPAQSSRLEKEQHPERYCPDRRCLWRIVTRDGFNPCRNHPHLMPKENTDAQAR